MIRRLSAPAAGLLFLLFSLPLSEAEVFKWKDQHGVVHYSSKQPFKGARPAELPPITKGEVKIPKVPGESCSNHGGVNCTLGPDQDGSVICMDGFRDSAARFIFSCSTPKLAIAEVKEPDGAGAVTVIVRNSRGVRADKPVLIYRGADGKELRVSGPDQLEPFGTVEFKLQPTDGVFEERPAFEELTITCLNCP